MVHVRVALAGFALFLVAAGGGGGRRVHPRLAGARGSVLPERRQRRLRRRQLRLDARLRPGHRRLDGTADVTARATQNLSRFDLDLRGFEISRLLVNGAAASSPRRAGAGDHARGRVRRGSAFTVVVDYAACRRWSPTPTSRSRAGCRPTTAPSWSASRRGRPAWYPCNDNPRDKATYDFRVTVPAGLTAMANGVLVSKATTGGKTTWVWRETEPMATVSRDGDARAVRPDDLDDGERASGRTSPSTRSSRRGRCSRSCRSRSSSTARSTGRTRSTRSARSSTTPRRRLLTRDADEAEVHRMPDEATLVPRALAHVVRRLGDADGVARHLAARGLRHLVGVDLERAPGQQVGAPVVQAPLQHPGAGHGVLDAAARRPRAAGLPVQRDDLLPRRHDAAGPAREDRRRGLLRGSSATGRPRTATAT